MDADAGDRIPSGFAGRLEGTIPSPIRHSHSQAIEPIVWFSGYTVVYRGRLLERSSPCPVA